MFQRFARCGALIAQHAQVMPIPLRALAMTVEQQPLEFVIVLALERQRKHIVIVPRRPVQVNAVYFTAAELCHLRQLFVIDLNRIYNNHFNNSSQPYKRHKG